jgi:hypothetical protein
MKIQACLAEGHDFFAPGKLFQFCKRFGGYIACIVRMDSDCGVHILKFFCKLDRFAILLRVGANGEPTGNTRGDTSSDNGIDVVGQLFKR